MVPKCGCVIWLRQNQLEPLLTKFVFVAPSQTPESESLGSGVGPGVPADSDVQRGWEPLTLSARLSHWLNGIAKSDSAGVGHPATPRSGRRKQVKASTYKPWSSAYSAKNTGLESVTQTGLESQFCHLMALSLEMT